jgi:hypothetical protein
MEQQQHPNTHPQHKAQRTARAKQFMKYACMLWIAALASGTVYRFTEKHSVISAITLPIAIVALITGTSFAMGALFLRLPNNK